MKILRELSEIKNVCLGMGLFDGVHIGHKKLLETLVSNASKRNTASVILTLKNSPSEVFTGSAEYITTLEERELLIEKSGVDYVVELDFDDRLKSMSAAEYLEKVVFGYFSPKYIVTGFNHTFGNGKMGKPQFLRDNQDKYGYVYEELQPVRFNDEIVSSTLIKQLLRKGDIIRAAEFSGQHFVISGEVIKGNQLGRTIGFPTANIVYPDKKVKIPFGVYKADVCYSGQTYRGMLNYGLKPTVNQKGENPVAEVHILDFNRDIYGENIEISVIDKIRDEKRFESLEELKKQIIKDFKVC